MFRGNRGRDIGGENICMRQRDGWQSDLGGQLSQAKTSSTRLLVALDVECVRRVWIAILDSSPNFSQEKLTKLYPRQDVVPPLSGNLQLRRRLYSRSYKCYQAVNVAGLFRRIPQPFPIYTHLSQYSPILELSHILVSHVCELAFLWTLMRMARSTRVEIHSQRHQGPLNETSANRTTSMIKCIFIAMLDFPNKIFTTIAQSEM